MPSIEADFPPKLYPLFKPKRYKVTWGGRGSAKSWSYARALLLRAALQPTRILCARELQVSLQDSVHKLLSDQIESLGLQDYFKVTKFGIDPRNGSQIIFAGLRNEVTKIKSTEGVDICWIEEAEKVSHRSWEVVVPTIRKPGSEIWVTYNPDLETDPTDIKFRKHPSDDMWVQELNWRDNPWFPDVLRAEKDHLARVDPEAYQHVWEGGYRTQSQAQIFRGRYRVEAFEPEPDWDGPYFGADWGFSTDPTVLVKLWIRQGTRKARQTLFIEKEVYRIGLEIDDTVEAFLSVPGADRYTIRGDSARPETISYLKRHGLPRIVAAEKWPGCVEDGIAYLKTFDIVIHPDCRGTVQDAKLYSYKVDRVTGDVLPDIVDEHNHAWDAIRYALERPIRSKGPGKILVAGQRLVSNTRF